MKRNQSKYDNDTSRFLDELAGEQSFKDFAKSLGMTYASLHNARKIDRISYGLFGKIVSVCDLSEEKKEELKKLV